MLWAERFLCPACCLCLLPLLHCCFHIIEEAMELVRRKLVVKGHLGAMFLWQRLASRRCLDILRAPLVGAETKRLSPTCSHRG